MKKNEIVSIIVPAYNAERTINRCIDSILKQSYGNLEIIIINDGSKDSTEEKCMKYIKNKKIKYIRIKNSGVSNARNVGIENSTGTYIMFVDSDDYIEKNMVERLYDNINENVDLVICSKNLITVNEKISEKIDIASCTLKKENIIQLYRAKILNPPYCKLYRSEIIKNKSIRFDISISIGEDLLFNILYLKNITKDIKILNENLYNYEKINTNSLSVRYYSNMLEMKKKITDELKRYELDTEEKELQLQLIMFDLLFSAVTNELKNKNRNFLIRYINGYKIIHNQDFNSQIKKMKEYKLMSDKEYKILNSYFYIFFIIFIRKKYRII